MALTCNLVGPQRVQKVWISPLRGGSMHEGSFGKTEDRFPVRCRCEFSMCKNDVGISRQREEEDLVS